MTLTSKGKITFLKREIKEEKLRKDIEKWHKNSDKRNFFIGEKRKVKTSK